MQEVTIYTITGQHEAFVGDYMTFSKYNIEPMQRVVGASPPEFVAARTNRPVRLLARGHERFYVCVDPDAAELMRICADLDLQDEIKTLQEKLNRARTESLARQSDLDLMTAEAARRAALPWWRRVWEALRA